MQHIFSFEQNHLTELSNYQSFQQARLFLGSSVNCEKIGRIFHCDVLLVIESTFVETFILSLGKGGHSFKKASSNSIL